jgi:osmoprotectant transport system permease protein
MRFLLTPANYDLADPAGIPQLLIQHLQIVSASMLIALAIALPLGWLVTRYPRLYVPVITVAGLLYTIPGLALLALLVPLTGLNASTIIIPLVIYAQLVLVRNTAAAINGIDPILLDVGRAMGMNRWQLFRRVTAPLALPLIIAGVRVATVTTIGIASLAALVGAGGLGDLIFGSIQNANYDEVLGGGILIASVAVSFDFLLLGIQTMLDRGRNVTSSA